MLQDAPINPDEVGEELNVEMVERGGEIVPVINRKNPTRKIPFAFDIPFASDGETSEEEGSPRKGRHETHDERYLSGMESSDEEMDTRRQKKEKKRRLAEMEHDVYEHFVGAEADPMANMIAAGDDIAIAEGATVEEEEYPDEENVCYGDENDAEPTALAQHNDGVRVKNVRLIDLSCFFENDLFILGWYSRVYQLVRVCQVHDPGKKRGSVPIPRKR